MSQKTRSHLKRSGLYVLLVAFLVAAFFALRSNANYSLCGVQSPYAVGCEGQQEPPGCCPDECCLPGHEGSGPGSFPGGIVGGGPGGGNAQRGSSPCSSCQGMAAWWVSEPYISLRVEDEPLWYQPGLGKTIAFRLSYRQRGETPETNAIFGVGYNWSSSFRTYVILNGYAARLHRGGAGYLPYNLDTPHLLDGSILTDTNGIVLQNADGSRLTFGEAFGVDGVSLYFLTSQSDPQGNTVTYVYTNNGTAIRLQSVRDAEGRLTQLQYTNTAFPNHITQVTDPFGRTARLEYNTNGMLAKITDTIGLTSSFVYATNQSWITQLITPYGTNHFRYGGVDSETRTFTTETNAANRFVEVTLPTGGRHLYVYRQTSTNLVPSTYTVPATYPMFDTFEMDGMDKRNSYHWGPLQASGLSTTNVHSLTSGDYAIAHLKHWLVDHHDQPTHVLSLERLPSPGGSVPGQPTFYDYAGKNAHDRIGFSAQPFLIARVLPDGTSWFNSFERNSLGKPLIATSTHTTPAGTVDVRTNWFTYSDDGIDLVNTYGPEGELVRSNYYAAGSHQPSISYDALGQATVYGYNAYGQLTSIQRPSDLTTLHVYGTSGTESNRLTASIDVEIGRTNSYTHYANGLVATHTDERNLTVTSYWDDLQRLTGQVYPNGATTNLYTALDLTASRDRMGHWSYSLYNGLRQKVAETNANGVVTQYQYCDCGVLQTVKAALGTPVEQTTSYSYDYQGRAWLEALPDESVTNWFNALGQRTFRLSGAGVRAYAYNNQGLLTGVTNVYGTEQWVVYDLHDRPLWSTDANGVTVTNRYDELDRLVQRRTGAGTTSFGYSARGLSAQTNEIGSVTRFVHDPAGRNLIETNANLETLFFTNSPAGDLVALVDGKGQVTRWNFDAYGRVTNKIDQAGSEILRYAYDPDNRLTNRWSAAKGNTVYRYDALGNLTNVVYPSSTNLVFQHDPLNRLTNMVDAVGTTRYTYTPGGRLLSEDGPFANDTLTNGYLAGLRRELSLQQPAGFWTNAFGFDQAGRLTNVTSPAGAFGYLLSVTAPASPLISRIALPNTAHITNLFDAQGRLTATYLKNSSGGVLDKTEYAYNAASQRTMASNSFAERIEYAYDPLGQLKVADSSLNSVDRGYAFDTAWNLAWRTNAGTAESFSVDSRNQLTSVPGGAVTYDSNGNMLSTDNTGRRYGYDDENQLVTITVTNGTTHYFTALVYDGLLRLRQRFEFRADSVPPTNPPPEEEMSALIGELEGNVVQPPSTNWSFVSETRYLYDAMRVIQERDASNTPTVSYTRGTDLSGSPEGAGGIGGLLGRSHGYSSGNWSTHNYYHADGNGNVTALQTSAQGLAARYEYDPFGNTIQSQGALADANVYRFSSKEYHAVSGLYYYGYRWYAPALQRWVNKDPIGEAGGRNLYSFVANNPLVGIDALGLKLITLPPGAEAPPGYSPCGYQIKPDGSRENYWCKSDPPQPLPPWMQPPGQPKCPEKNSPRDCWQDPDPALKATEAWQSACELAWRTCDVCCANNAANDQSFDLQSCMANCAAKAGACFQGRSSPTPPSPPPVIFPENPPRPNVPPRPKS